LWRECRIEDGSRRCWSSDWTAEAGGLMAASALIELVCVGSSVGCRSVARGCACLLMELR